MKNGELILPGLSQAEKRSLEKELDQPSLKFQEVEIPNASFGEPTTVIAIIYLSSAVLFAVSLWLARKVTFEETTYELAVRDKDGSEKNLTIRSRQTVTETQKDIVEELGKAAKIDVTELLTQIKG
jgi:hypothetical protein